MLSLIETSVSALKPGNFSQHYDLTSTGFTPTNRKQADIPTLSHLPNRSKEMQNLSLYEAEMKKCPLKTKIANT